LKYDLNNSYFGGVTVQLEIIESAMRGNEGMDACCGLYDDYYSTYK